MLECLYLPVKKQDIEKLKAFSRTATVYNILGANIKQIQSLLFAYHYHLRERVFDVRIDKRSITFSDKKIKFNALYKIETSNTCADIDYTDNAKMTIDMVVNPEKYTALLTGEYWPERDQNEI